MGERPHTMINFDPFLLPIVYGLFAGLALFVGAFTAAIAASSYPGFFVLVVAVAAVIVGVACWRHPRGRSRTRGYWAFAFALGSLNQIAYYGQFRNSPVFAIAWAISMGLLGSSIYLFYWWCRWAYLPPRLDHPVVRST